MTGNRESTAANRLSTVLAAMAAVDGELSVLDRLCKAGAGLLSSRGAGISLMVDGELRGTAGASDPGAVVVQELQFELGEGPCLDAWASMEPVTSPTTPLTRKKALQGAADGIHLPLPLCHSDLAELVGAARPTVTIALRELADTGQVWRSEDRTWMLKKDPPAELRDLQRHEKELSGVCAQ